LNRKKVKVVLRGRFSLTGNKSQTRVDARPGPRGKKRSSGKQFTKQTKGNHQREYEKRWGKNPSLKGKL